MDSEVRILLAEAYRIAADYRQAINEYDQIVAAEPANAYALNNLAWVYFLANDARAEATARKAYALKPDNGSIADTLGWILIDRGSLDEGTDLLRKAVELTSGRAEIRYHLAAALSKAGDNGEARQLLQDILSTNEQFASRRDAQELLAQL